MNMDANLKSKLGGFVILIGIAVGCSTVHTAPSKNEVVTKPLPTTQNSQPSGGEVTNEKGWQVPSPKAKRKIRTTEDILLSDDGKKVKVTTTYFVPIEKYIYTEEATASNRTVVNGDLELGDLVESKVGEKVF